MILSRSGEGLGEGIGSLQGQLEGLTSQLDALTSSVRDLKDRAGDGVDTLNEFSGRLGGVEDEEEGFLRGFRNSCR